MRQGVFLVVEGGREVGRGGKPKEAKEWKSATP